MANLDTTFFRLINQVWTSGVLDVLMPFLSGNRFFFPVLFAVLAWTWLRLGRRGKCFIILLAFSLLVGELTLTGPLKKWIGRPRPFVTEPSARVLVGKGPSFAMPSGHSAIWAAAAVVTLHFYRRLWIVMIPLAFGVGYSRIYNGVHWPSDVLGGWGVGAAYGWLGMRLGSALWSFAGARWFPLWWRQCPSLLHPDRTVDSNSAEAASPAEASQHWARLSWVLLLALAGARIAYIASPIIELSEDEAYQWLWSKHPDWSYYSKPPLIAYTQWLGTHLWGDRALGVRFFSPVIALVLGLLMRRTIADWSDARSAFLFLAAVTAVPLLAGGSILMTIDPLNVLFWVGGMLAAWRAMTTTQTGWWIVTGLCWGGGFLSKYTSPLQWLALGIFMALWPPARTHVRRPGLWIAVGISLVCTLPVLIWNANHGAVTVTHLTERGGLDQPWQFRFSLVRDFVLAVFGLLNPLFVIPMSIAAWKVWKRLRNPPERSESADMGRDQTAFLALLFAHSIPLVVFWSAYTVRARVLPNWISPAVLPWLALGFLHGLDEWRRGVRSGVRWLSWGIVVGLPVVILVHNTAWIEKAVGSPLSPRLDPLRRLRGWSDAAAEIEKARVRLARDGRKPFIIADHYGRAGLFSFYHPEARAGVPDHPIVYVISSDRPENQFWFWPGYRGRKGEDAVFVLDGRADDLRANRLLSRLRREFDVVDDAGFVEPRTRDRSYRRLHLFHCRNQR